VVYGARQSLVIGLFAALSSCVLGASIGLTAGYAGGVLDMLLMRFIDVWMAIPNVLLAIALATALGPSLQSIIIAVSVVFVPRYARIVRGQAMALRAQAFIEAARAAGASHFSILRRHLLPHCSASIVVLLTVGVGQSILLGTVLSFVGLGVNDEQPDWGYQLMQGRGYLSVAPWAVTYPGLAIGALVISVNLLGEALQRRLDPRRGAR
jgi:peptide/nickel transport system permease protein